VNYLMFLKRLVEQSAVEAEKEGQTRLTGEFVEEAAKFVLREFRG